MQSDCDLMVQTSAGDLRAFETLVERHRDRLQGFLYRLCWNWEEASDCAQETFVRLWLARRNYRPQAKFTTYLYTIARRCWLDRTRRRRCRPQTISLEEQIGAGAQSLMRRMIEHAESPENVVLRRYEMFRIRRAIGQLPEDQRLVFTLAHFEDVPYAEIAEILGIPVGTVKSRMHYAVTRLRSLLRD